MPPNTGTQQAGLTPEQALSSLLSSEQLTELVVLISSITDSMRKKVTDAFDVNEDSNTLRPRERLPREDETDAEARARRLQARRERELSEPRLQDLKNDAVEHFQTWRDGIVSRIVDALNAKDEEVTGPGSDNGAARPPDYNGLSRGPQPTTTTTTTTTSASFSLFSHLYPPTRTNLSSLPEENRTTLLSTLLLLLLSQGSYSSHSRILLLYLTSSLHLSPSMLQNHETTLARGLLAVSAQMSASAEAQKRSAESVSSRRWKVGLAGLAGAVAIGVTGGLAAPLVASAIGTVMGGIGLGATAAAGLLGTLGGSGVVVGSLFGAYGYGMGGRMMEKYAREVEDFAFLEMRRWQRRGTRGGGEQSRSEAKGEERRLRVTVGVSGWLGEEKDVVKPWRSLGRQSEVFALRWELEALIEMGKSLESMVSSVAWTVATREIIVRTAFASLMFAMWPIALAGIVDNPFSVAKSRADKAGLVLADALINKAQGERPVTLIGYSMGARLIYSCLTSLAECRAFGLVESVVLIGTPAPSDASVWRAIRSVVAGRLVNVYSEKDFVLAYLYRTSSIQFGVAGLEEVENVKGVENVDVTAIVSGHMRYPRLIGTILENIGWEDINTQEVERERLVIKMLDEEEEKKIAEQLEANASVKAQEMRKKDDISALCVAPGNEVARDENLPKLPSRKIVRNRSGPVTADQDLLKPPHTRRPTGDPIEDALSQELTKYVEEVSEQKFRCHVPDCQKFFRDESFWRIHVEKRHTEWFEAIKETVRLEVLQREKLPAYDAAVQKPEQNVVPNLPLRPTMKAEKDDLMSFDHVVEREGLKGEKPAVPLGGGKERETSILDREEEGHPLQDSSPKEGNPVLPEQPRQVSMTDISTDHPLQPLSSNVSNPVLPERPSQRGVMDAPEQHQLASDTPDSRPTIPERPRQLSITATHPLQNSPPKPSNPILPHGPTSTPTQQRAMEIPDLVHRQASERLDRPGWRHEGYTHQYDADIYDDDDDEDSGGITMIDNEAEGGITMLEPEPWDGD